jgi:hypothetical protein
LTTTISVFAVPLIVALISGPMMWALKRMDAHRIMSDERNHEVLVEIRDNIKNVNSRMDEHIAWHGLNGWKASA